MTMNKEELIIGKYYTGLNRFSCGIGLWTGYEFLGFGNKFGHYVEKSMDFYPEITYTLLEIKE